VTAAIAKVEHQAEKVKGKLEARKRRPAVAKDAVEAVVVEAPRVRRAAARGEQEAVSARVIRVRRPSAKPMLLEDALPRLDAAPGSVVVFRDAALDRLQVLVRRADGHIGLVDADA
jgi:hypothetical protein